MHELARQAAAGSDRPTLKPGLAGRIKAAEREILVRVAIAGVAFDTDEFVALSGRPEHEAFDHLDAALAAPLEQQAGAGYRFGIRLCARLCWKAFPRIGCGRRTATSPTG